MSSIEMPEAKPTITPTAQSNLLLDQWTHLVVTYTLLLVLSVTLFPYEFFFNNVINRFDHKNFILQLSNTSSLGDVLINILLFLPFGFGLTSVIRKRKWKEGTALAVILVTGASLSFVVEALQLFLPSRDPSFTDILTNSVGTFLGLVCFRLWGIKIITRVSVIIEMNKRYVSIKNLTIGLIGYATVTILISIVLQPGTNDLTNFSNWEQTFPLLVGNEQTGNRPWQGTMFELSIIGKALSKEDVTQTFSQEDQSVSTKTSLLALYRFTGTENYSDQTGNLPDLSWKGVSPDIQVGSGVYLTPNHWLETTAPASFLAQKLRETSQLTLITIVATANKFQTGPARIVSLSQDPYHRNFTLGQEGPDLVFRLRTPLTGENGTNPEQIFPNVFTDTNAHHLVISYDGVALLLYVDGVQHRCSFERSPGTALLSRLLPLQACNMVGYQTLYYGVILIPLGLSLVLILTISRWGFVSQTIFICSGVLSVSLILEIVLMATEGRVVKPENLLLSMVIMAGATLLFKIQMASWIRGNGMDSAEKTRMLARF